MDIEQYKYACGNPPMVGDLIEFGTRSQRLIVTSIDDEAAEFSIHCGSFRFQEYSLKLTRLIARHGEPVAAT